MSPRQPPLRKGGIIRRSATLTWSVALIMLLAGCQPAAPSLQTPAVTPTATPTSQLAAETPNAEKVASVELTVAMAADLRFVMNELLKEFHSKHPEVSIKPNFSSSGNLFAQISNNAPFDVFLSADIQFPEKLAAQDLTVKDSLFKYAIGHIVLWVRNDSPLAVDQGVSILKDASVKKVAIANPKLAPYGRAAEAALKKLEVYDAIQDKLVLGDNVAQTAQFAETGAADVAVIALSFARAPEFSNKGKFWEFPNDSYPPLDQGGVILKQSRHVEEARKFCDFLKTSEAVEIFRKFGFVVPE